MDAPFLYPLHEQASFLLRHCKLAPHTGTGTVAAHGDPADRPFLRFARAAQRRQGLREVDPYVGRFAVTVLSPAAGGCLLLLSGEAAGHLSRHFGEGLTASGESPDGPFELLCPLYYVKAVSGRMEQHPWAIAKPVNSPLTITYGPPRPAARVCAAINNFDFDYGNVPTLPSVPGAPPALRVEAAGHTVEFSWREGRQELRQLVDVGVLNNASLTTFTFHAWPDSLEEELSRFAYHVASLCAVVARQHTGVPVLSFLDGEGRVIKRVVGNPVESQCRRNYVIRDLHLDDGLPQLFRECFEEHVQMQRSELWRRMSAFCASVEDSPYLEQKFASLMAAVESLIKSSLVEKAHCSAEEAGRLSLPQLLGAARGKLGWTIPGHYTTRDRHRLLRNAVAHGGRLPDDAVRVRHEFDKWHLFLLRRLLVRLGFTGEVASPRAGFAAVSPVDDFREEHNDFST